MLAATLWLSAQAGACTTPSAPPAHPPATPVPTSTQERFDQPSAVAYAPSPADAARAPKALQPAAEVAPARVRQPAPRALRRAAAKQGSARMSAEFDSPLALVEQPEAEFNTEAYAPRTENRFVQVSDTPLSTFSIDVDTASYSNVRRFLQQGQRPPHGAVRVEEMINYFRYDYPQPAAGEPFALFTESARAPWNGKHRLLQIGLRARDIAQRDVPARNLVFLIDVSGSMESPDKLPLLKRALGLLVRELRPADRIAIVTYAGNAGLVLPSTAGSERGRIAQALEELESGGSTNGGEGIVLAYQTARKHFIEGGVNRVILATDGDFNVGVSSESELTTMIETQRKSGVFLSVLGFGTGNVKDSTMELLADKGDGNYAYIDNLAEAQKVLVHEAGATLVTLARDVKLQVEWNPARVRSYRLIGYENRLLADRDFNDDQKDAGEIGSGQTVTALYEVELQNDKAAQSSEVDPLKYQDGRPLTAAAQGPELMTLKVRYKAPEGGPSTLMTRTALDADRTADQASNDFRWAAAVAGYGMLLGDSKQRGELNWKLVRSLASGGLGNEPSAERREFLELLDRAGSLKRDG